MKRRDMLKGDGLMKLYLLRVGADSTKLGGGFYSHICPDSKYIFIPIPEAKEKLTIKDAITYHPGEKGYKWNNQPVPDYLLPRICGRYVHNDPEFKTFTYGSPQLNQNGSKEKNYETLAGMKEGDMLTFYAAFTSNGHDIEGYYFFAYFIVDRAINLDKLTNKETGLVKGNHHFIHRHKLLKNQVIVKGHSKKSRVFQKAVLFCSPKYRVGSNYHPCKNVQNLLGGYDKSMNRSSIRKIPLSKGGIDEFKKHLDDHGERLRDP